VDGTRWRRPVGLALAFLAGAALPAVATWAGLTDRISWEAWVHDSAGHFDWTPFIHPPLYNEVLWLGERAAEFTGLRPAALLALVNVLLAGIVAAAVAAATLRRSGTGAAVAVTALVALSAAPMRPFEQYPMSRLLVVLAVLGCLALAREDARGRRWLAGGTFVCAFAAVELHLNAWLVLGPLLSVLAWANPSRRRPLLLVLGGLLLGFGATALRGLPQVLRDGPMNEPGWSPPMSLEAVTFEWANVMLLFALVLWAVPTVRRRCSPRVAGALSAALLLHLAVVGWQMYAGLAIGGHFVIKHHYYDLVDALMALAAVWAMWDARDRPGWRWATALALAGLLLWQLWLVRTCWWSMGLPSPALDSWL